MKNAQTEGFLSIGQVLRPQGLKGQVKIRPDTDDPGRFAALGHVYVQDASNRMSQIALRDVSVRGNFVFANLGDDGTVEEAETRRDLTLYLPRDEASPLGEHENYIADIIGCRMMDTAGHVIGIVEDVLQPGANDVYVVGTQAGGRALVPALRSVILRVDVAAREILVDAERLMEVTVFED